jgi:hypothetical protein
VKTRLIVAVTALAVVVLGGGWLLGDDPKKPDDLTPAKMRGFLPAHFKKLGLTDKQVQDVYKIQTEYRDKIEALQKQIDDLKKSEKGEVDKVLTDDQKSRLKEILLGEPADKDKPKDKAPEKDKPADTDKAPVKDKPADKDK